MKKIFIPLIIILLFYGELKAQNPFEKYGYHMEMLTMTNGKFNEFFDLDSIQQIGDVLINTNTMKIVGFAEKDSINPLPDASVISRWVSSDALAEKYYFISPYSYVADNPVIFVDPNGMDIVIYYDNGKEYNFNGDASNAPNNPYVQEVITAYNIMKEKGGGNFVDLVNNSDVKNVQMMDVGFTSWLDAATCYDPNYSEGSVIIRWDPREGLLTNKGKNVITPVENLEHESDHVRRAISDPNWNNEWDYENSIPMDETKALKAEQDFTTRNGGVPRKNYVDAMIVITTGLNTRNIDVNLTKKYIEKAGRALGNTKMHIDEYKDYFKNNKINPNLYENY